MRDGAHIMVIEEGLEEISIQAFFACAWSGNGFFPGEGRVEGLG